jgi:hypothetical protein
MAKFRFFGHVAAISSMNIFSFCLLFLVQKCWPQKAFKAEFAIRIRSILLNMILENSIFYSCCRTI